ncbi:nitroreductase family deazaflavin-dependent oxidoreductase [Mycobacterium syngnathidarum]
MAYKYRAPDLSLMGADHVRRYCDTSGEIGYLWNGVPTLLLTATGRRSGQRHTTALIFTRDDADYLVVASYGGALRHPAWYLNITENPSVGIQVRDKRFRATARVARHDEKRRLWNLVTDCWPNYDAYQSRTEREIPVVVLTPE